MNYEFDVFKCVIVPLWAVLALSYTSLLMIRQMPLCRLFVILYDGRAEKSDLL